MVEYGMILGLIALVVVPALLWLGQFATNTFQDTSRAMDGQTVSDPYDKSPPNNETTGDLGKAQPLLPSR